ncbi:uncharacterized protein LOC131975100 [Centropristis striata]|uniref:uncharacterized protein LOC131975100 n=1 Tax=Centropristis striata TaxID=184440 RepID=UPI0027E0A880|nr:uncharacterized protein LOC131975100 [Centropristis striata]
MMDNLTTNKSHISCQSWAGQIGWSAISTQGSVLNPQPGSQHVSLGSSSDQRPSYDQLLSSNQSCMSDLSSLSSRNKTHPSALYKTSHISSNPSSNTLFANTAIPSASHIISFAQQSSHTSSTLLTANLGKIISPPPLPQTNQAPQPCRPQHLPYKTPFQPPLINQSLPNGLQDLPISLPSCGQRASTSQATFEGVNEEFAGYTHSHASSTSQEQRQWISPSHCRGAVNESVPNAASPSNKEPMEEGNIGLSDNNEIQRLVLLHQREQLLKQVAELDKLLGTMPAEDDSSEQNMTKDAQRVRLSGKKSKSRLYADCSSPESYDVQSETCDSPDDPMSAAEQEKKGNASAGSEEESDPDYFPHSDSDFSDFLSDPEEGSSDDSSLSTPSIPTADTPSLPVKTRAKLASSLSKDNPVGGLKRIRAANQRRSSATLVSPSSNSKTHRVYDRRNYCVFCSKPMSKMARHLERIHSDKTEVAAAFQFPKNSKERQKIWNRLINQGNFAHNKDVLKTGEGELAVRKRPSKTKKAQDFLHCLYCRGLYGKKALPRHMKSCPERKGNENECEIGRKRIAVRCVLESLEDLGVTDGFKSVLSQMKYDDVTQAVMDDEVILQFGELLYNQHGSDVKKHDYIRQNLRQIARLVLEAQKITPLKKLEDFFLPSSFPHVVSAVNVLAGYNPGNKTYTIPSLAIKLGYHLQKTCSIVEDNAVKCGDESLAESARNFLSVYQKEWNKLISAGALTTLRETKSHTDKKVPFAKDVKLLNSHMENVHLLAEKNLRETPSAETYGALSRVILSRTILFNRRRPGEVSALQLTAFMSRKKSNLYDGMDISVSDLEKQMCVFFTRVDIRGKCGRMVPVLFKESFVSALELLIKVRETCGVPGKNPFLFGRPHAMSAYNGSECIQKYVKECGAEEPEALTSTKLRKHYATMLLVMNLDENEADQIWGPNNQVRRLRQDGSMQQGDVEMVYDERGQHVASWDHSEFPDARFGPAVFYHEHTHGAATGSRMTEPPTSADSGKKGSQNKHKWDEAEVLAVERHLMHLIQEHKVPQKNDCIQCLEAEPEALRSRSWKGVKDYVRNRITALKRQSGTYKVESTNSNCSWQEEPQQSAAHFHQL